MSTVQLIQRFPEQAAGRMREQLPTVAETVAERARALCPVATGALRRSIGVATDITSVSVGSDLPYAGVIEYGTSKRMAQPYLRPALDSLQVNPPRLTPS